MGEGDRGRPTGTVSFLFTDIEGSTPLWERHPDAMRRALARHDQILRAAIDDHDGFVFSTAGDAFSAAFSTPGDAVGAALAIQKELQGEPWPHDAPVRVRMGIHLGAVEERDGDYFGSAVNRAARLMGLAHGGQVLVSLAVEELVRDDLADGVGLWTLGEYALKGLSRPETVFQLTATDLEEAFPPLVAAASVPGNLRSPPTSFVGRDVEVAELVELVGSNRLVTLTGVGGVGKTRLAIEVAGELAHRFGGGVWLIELAPVGDPAAVPDVVATALGITPQAGLTVTDSVAQALAGRQLLIVIDNCEHVLEVAAGLVETILARADAVTVVATSREGLRVPAERLWPVPSLEATSAAVELFADRALAVSPNFDLAASGVGEAVVEICERLDGIALGIELAAARMVSMSAQDIRDRLDDRFRLLAGPRRGLERHQTLRQAVGWSFDLLDDDERFVLCRCAVFADGFDVEAAAHLCGETGLDEYAVLDTLDSLVRKSLVTVDRAAGHARYGMLETIRQYADDRLAATGDGAEIRDHHSAYFAAKVLAYWDLWDGPNQRATVDWVDAEFANLRSGFRWALEQGDLATAAAIAAHTAMLAHMLQRYEPVGWAEETLSKADASDLAQLPRVYTAAALCSFIGRADAGLVHARTAVGLEADPRHDPFEPGWSRMFEGVAELYCDHPDRILELCEYMAAQPGFSHVHGRCGLLWTLPAIGRADEAIAIAEETMSQARASENPYLLTFALAGYGRAFGQHDPPKALMALREGLACAQEHRIEFWGTNIAREAAELEAVHGELDDALELFMIALDKFHHAGDDGNVAATLACLALLFDRFNKPEIAATVYGASCKHPETHWWIVSLPDVLDHLREALGATAFEKQVADGAAMQLVDAVHYARHQIQLAGQANA